MLEDQPIDAMPAAGCQCPVTPHPAVPAAFGLCEEPKVWHHLHVQGGAAAHRQDDGAPAAGRACAAPASCGRLLAGVAQQEGDWATLALSCARDLVMHRIPDRWAPDAIVLAQQDRQWATQCSAACQKPYRAMQARRCA